MNVTSAEVAAELEGAGHVIGQSHDAAGCEAGVYKLLVDKVVGWSARLFGDILHSTVGIWNPLS